MKIGELARRSGLSPSRIRFYEARGLIQAVPRAGNGYRQYPEQAELLLALIAAAQQAGFLLEEIRQILPADLKAWRVPELVAAVERKLAEITQEQARLQQRQKGLQALLLQLGDYQPGSGNCLGNVQNAQRVFDNLQRGQASQKDITST